MQRFFLVKILKSWKTISFDECSFLSGILPLEYLIIQRASVYWSKRDGLRLNDCLGILNVEFTPVELEGRPDSKSTFTLISKKT